MSQENSYPSISSESGWLNIQLGIGHGLQDALERELVNRREESENPESDQLQKTLSRTSRMSTRELIRFSLTSGLGLNSGIRVSSKAKHRSFVRVLLWCVESVKRSCSSAKN